MNTMPVLEGTRRGYPWPRVWVLSGARVRASSASVCACRIATFCRSLSQGSMFVGSRMQ